MGRVLIGMVCAAALALGACGEDDSSTTAEEEPSTSAPAAEQSLDDAVAGLNTAIEEQDCEALLALSFSTTRISVDDDAPAEPDQPVQPEECGKDAPAPPLLADLEGTTFDESEEYEGAAISQGEAGEPVGGYDHWAVLWMVDRDGMWRNIGFYPTDPQFEEELGEGADPVDTTEQLLDAVRTGDCSNAEEFVSKFTRFGDQPDDGCEALISGSIFAPAVKSAGEDVVVEELGRSRDYALVGVDTGDAYFGVALNTPPIKPDQPPQSELLIAEVVPLTDFEIVPPKEAK